MKNFVLHLRFIAAMVKADFNMSRAAQIAYTSQPNLCKHFKNIESYFEKAIFQKQGNSYVGLTSFGEELVKLSKEVDLIEDKLKELKFEGDSKGIKRKRPRRKK